MLSPNLFLFIFCSGQQLLLFLKSIVWGSQKEKSKQGVDMIITPHPVVTITIMSNYEFF